MPKSVNRFYTCKIYLRINLSSYMTKHVSRTESSNTFKNSVREAGEMSPICPRYTSSDVVERTITSVLPSPLNEACPSGWT